jgi:hypothetical protein
VFECSHGEPGDAYEPLNLEVVVVKPKWLCGTFAFHPMLGFRRVEQARSIAHGCMTTLKKLEQLGRAHPDWLNAWGVKQPAEWSDAPEHKRRELGHCWYRKGCVCPFSEQGLGALEGTEAFRPATRRALSVIYKECGNAATHAARKA